MVRRVNSWVPTSPVHVAHLGYVSLFPFMMRLIPADTEQLEASLTHIRDPNTLWTPYGVRYSQEIQLFQNLEIGQFS